MSIYKKLHDGTPEKKPFKSLASQVAEATTKGRDIMEMEQRAIDADIANRKQLGVQAPLHVRTAEAAAKIARGEMASADHSKWGQYSPLKPKKS